MTWKTTFALAALITLVAGACSTQPPRVPRARAVPEPHAEPASSPRWRAETPGEPGALSADERGSVVQVGSEVVALAPDGTQQWRVQYIDLGIQYPALDDDLVVVSTVTDRDTGTRGEFIALDRATGEERWRAAAPGEPGPVTFADDRIFVATDHGDVYALTRGGDTLWHWNDKVGVSISSRGSIAYDPETATLGITVFVRERGWYIAMLDARTGRMHHIYDLGAGEPPSATVAAGHGRFVVGSGETHELVVIDLHRLEATYAVRTDAAFDPANQPVVDGDVAIAVDGAGTVTAMDITTGRLRWQRALDMAVTDVRPVLTREAVVLNGFLAPLTVLGRADGRPIDGPLAHLDGIPVGYGASGDEVIVSLRFAAPGRVESWPAP
jgi:outer membrane protein assembly factor BamB